KLRRGWWMLQPPLRHHGEPACLGLVPRVEPWLTHTAVLQRTQREGWVRGGLGSLLCQGGNESALDHLVAFARSELVDAAGTRRVQHMLHLHGLDDGDAISLGDGCTLSDEHLRHPAD